MKNWERDRNEKICSGMSKWKMEETVKKMSENQMRALMVKLWVGNERLVELVEVSAKHYFCPSNVRHKLW